MNILSPLPVPSENWLRTLNERYRREEMSPAERPIRALEEWAAIHGQPRSFGSLVFSHLGGEAWRVIDRFFCKHTKLGHDRIQPLSRSAWFYDASFYEIKLFVILGGTGPVTTINPFKCLETSMPKSLLWEFSRDEPSVQEYLDHLSNALDSFVGADPIRQKLSQPFARKFLGAAEAHLDSAVTALLDNDPSREAVGHAIGHSRLTFETSLKALAAEKMQLTEKEARHDIRHRLDKLVGVKIIKCAHLFGAADFARIKDAAIDSATTQCLFPPHDAHYQAGNFAPRRLWNCYATAQHSLATVLRVLGAPDSRRPQSSAR
jgi:hypothetical protein